MNITLSFTHANSSRKIIRNTWSRDNTVQPTTNPIYTLDPKGLYILKCHLWYDQMYG